MSADLVNRLSTCTELDLVPESLVQIGPSSCRALSSHGPVVIRLVRTADPHHRQFLRALRRRSPDQVGLLQQLQGTVPCGDEVVAVFDWLQGTTARETGPHLLPRFFEALAAWHRDSRCDLPVYSPYTGEEYSDVAAFLDGETAYHLRRLARPALEGRCWELLRPIAAGFVTLLHGDVHPGNILHAADGTFRLLDPESVHIGCNFLDLDYIDWLALEPSPTPWWVIREYAQQSVAAYFSASGIDETKVRPVMTAVALLAALQSHTNGQRYTPDTMEESKLRIERILRSG
jgi:aminoglycoside phosphotransferase (APT) family kinase protein